MMPWRPPDPASDRHPNPECKHMHTKVWSSCSFGKGWCPECECEVFLDDVFNNFLDAMRKELNHDRD